MLTLHNVSLCKRRSKIFNYHLILLLMPSARAFERWYLEAAIIASLCRLIFFLRSRKEGILHLCAHDIHLSSIDSISSGPAFNSNRRFSFNKYARWRIGEVFAKKEICSCWLLDRLSGFFRSAYFVFLIDFARFF